MSNQVFLQNLDEKNGLLPAAPFSFSCCLKKRRSCWTNRP